LPVMRTYLGNASPFRVPEWKFRITLTLRELSPELNRFTGKAEFYIQVARSL
jgi:hypothetical protein